MGFFPLPKANPTTTNFDARLSGVPDHWLPDNWTFTEFQIIQLIEHFCDSIYRRYVIAKCREEGQGRGMMPGWTNKSDVKGIWRKRRKEKNI